MTGIVLQFISLVAYGNDFLANDNLPETFYQDNAEFKFCNHIAFKDFRANSPNDTEGILVASNPIKWFKHLKESGCEKLRLYFQYSNREDSPPDYKTAGMVGGGGFWRIEAQYADHFDSWASRWEVTRKDDPQRNIWSVTYGLLHREPEPTDLPCDLEVIKKVAIERLETIASFAKHYELQNWNKIFEEALTKLNSANPATDDFEKEMIPIKNYSLVAQQLLFAANKAWVFGGMGSWNDLSFDQDGDNQAYEELSYDLYDCICVSIIAAINSY